MGKTGLISADARGDAELLRAIASRRDEEAFNELLRRYERDTYGLAMRITGNRERAEETVQEAMIRAWSAAASYRGEGEVKAWLLSIVAREAIKILRQAKRKHVSMDEDLAGEKKHRASPQSSSAESSELFDALRQRIDRLPEIERQIVALHFAGGCSQTEISQALSIPQQTVSYRIGVILKNLRSELSAAGFAAAVPLLSDTGFGDALCSGIDVPLGLREKVLSRLAGAKPLSSRRLTRKGQAATSKSSGLLIAGVVTVAAAAAGVAYFTAKPAPQPPAPAPVPAVVVQAPKVPIKDRPMERPADWNKRWTFENDAAEDLFVATGSWTWNREAKAMDIPDSIHILPTYLLPDEPLVFTAKGKAINTEKQVSLGLAIYQNGKELKPLSFWKKLHRLDITEIEHTFYLYKTRLVMMMAGDPGFVQEFAEPFGNASAVLRIDNLSLRELTARPMKEQDVPDFVKHPEELIKTLTKQ